MEGTRGSLDDACFIMRQSRASATAHRFHGLMAEPLIVVLIGELTTPRADPAPQTPDGAARGLLLAQGREFRLSHATEDGIEASNLLCGQRLISCFGEPMAGWLSGLHRPADFRRTRGVTMGKFELYKDHHGGFRWQLKSTEGRTIAVSAEAHKTMSDLRENIATVKREAGGSHIDDQTATTF